jgi:hypothetical protein
MASVGGSGSAAAGGGDGIVVFPGDCVVTTDSVLGTCGSRWDAALSAFFGPHLLKELAVGSPRSSVGEATVVNTLDPSCPWLLHVPCYPCKASETAGDAGDRKSKCARFPFNFA